MDTSADPDQAMLDRIEEELADVERALSRLDDGSYGACEACGRPIAAELLASLPTARRCSEHATAKPTVEQPGSEPAAESETTAMPPAPTGAARPAPPVAPAESPVAPAEPASPAI